MKQSGDLGRSWEVAVGGVRGPCTLQQFNFCFVVENREMDKESFPIFHFN